MAKSDEKTIEEGKSALRREYYGDVKSIAKGIARGDYGDTDIDDAIHQAVDGSSWVIYTGQALDVLVASDNWEAIDDVGADTEGGISSYVTVAAYYALERDVREELDRMGVEMKSVKRKKTGLRNKLLR